MGEEGGIQFNGVARLEARFAEEFRRQFQRGDVACVHVDAGEVDDARGRLIARGRRPWARHPIGHPHCVQELIKEESSTDERIYEEIEWVFVGRPLRDWWRQFDIRTRGG
jgi:hypothetical protein